MTKDDLRIIAHEINTQDNRITADPLFCVFEKEQVCGMDPDYTDEWERYNSDQQCSCDPDSSCESVSEKCRKCYYIERDRFVNAHFTEKAALEHIRINGHNLRKPFTYVTSMFRCEEMIKIRNFLKQEAKTDQILEWARDGYCPFCGGENIEIEVVIRRGTSTDIAEVRANFSVAEEFAKALKLSGIIEILDRWQKKQEEESNGETN